MLNFPANPVEKQIVQVANTNYIFRNGLWEQYVKESGTIKKTYNYKSSENQGTIQGQDLDGKTLSFEPGYVDVIINGRTLSPGIDYTADANIITLNSPIIESDVSVLVIAYGVFSTADHYTKDEEDSKLDLKANKNGDTNETFKVLAPVIDTDAVNKEYLVNNSFGYKNLIINGNFDVWQRGTTFTSAGYTADRWIKDSAAGFTVTREECTVPGSKYSYKYLVQTAGVEFNLQQKIENTGQFYKGQKLTFSFYARANKDTVVRTLRAYDGHSYVTGYELKTITSEWTKFTTTMALSGDLVNDDYLRVSIANHSADLADLAVDDWVEVTQLQLEQGSEATMFEQRPYALELSLCKRYYQFIDMLSPTLDVHHLLDWYCSGDQYFNFPLPYTEMRVIPSTSSYIHNVSACETPRISVSKHSAHAYARKDDDTGRAYFYLDWVKLDAEL